MSIYFIQAGDANGPIKIGIAKHPEGRRRELQVGSHVPLTIVRLIDGNREDERALHRLFESLWLRGEWFGFDPRMLTVMPAELRRVEGLSPRRTQEGQWLRGERKRLGLTQKQLAMLMGIAIVYLSDVENGKRRLTENLIERLPAEFTPKRLAA